MDHLKELCCHGCPVLVSIGQMSELEYLDCSECPSLKEIPRTKTLRNLFCHKCPSLKEIPLFEHLRILSCSKCPLLRTIPPCPFLVKLYCSGCPLLEQIPRELDILQTLSIDKYPKNRCPFLYVPYNIRFLLDIKTPNYLIFRIKRVQLRYRLKVLARKILNQTPGTIKVLNDLIIGYC